MRKLSLLSLVILAYVWLSASSVLCQGQSETIPDVSVNPIYFSALTDYKTLGWSNSEKSTYFYFLQDLYLTMIPRGYESHRDGDNVTIDLIVKDRPNINPKEYAETYINGSYWPHVLLDGQKGLAVAAYRYSDVISSLNEAIAFIKTLPTPANFAQDVANRNSICAHVLQKDKDDFGAFRKKRLALTSTLYAKISHASDYSARHLIVESIAASGSDRGGSLSPQVKRDLAIRQKAAEDDEFSQKIVAAYVDGVATAPENPPHRYGDSNNWQYEPDWDQMRDYAEHWQKINALALMRSGADAHGKRVFDATLRATKPELLEVAQSVFLDARAHQGNRFGLPSIDDYNAVVTPWTTPKWVKQVNEKLVNVWGNLNSPENREFVGKVWLAAWQGIDEVRKLKGDQSALAYSQAPWNNQKLMSLVAKTKEGQRVLVQQVVLNTVASDKGELDSIRSFGVEGIANSDKWAETILSAKEELSDKSSNEDEVTYLKRRVGVVGLYGPITQKFTQAAVALWYVKSPLQTEDISVGSGPVARQGNTVEIKYSGTFTDGKEFDSSSVSFTIGAGQVIKGLESGVLGMSVGGKRKVTVPPELGYGANGAPPAVPGNATLVFEIELLRISR